MIHDMTVGVGNLDRTWQIMVAWWRGISQRKQNGGWLGAFQGQFVRSQRLSCNLQIVACCCWLLVVCLLLLVAAAQKQQSNDEQLKVKSSKTGWSHRAKGHPTDCNVARTPPGPHHKCCRCPSNCCIRRSFRMDRDSVVKRENPCILKPLLTATSIALLEHFLQVETWCIITKS